MFSVAGGSPSDSLLSEGDSAGEAALASPVVAPTAFEVVPGCAAAVVVATGPTGAEVLDCTPG